MRGRVLAVLFLAVVLAVVIASTVSFVTRPKVRMSEDAACPPLLTHTSNGADDYGDVVEWHGQSLWRTDERTSAGDQVGVVGCSISTMPNPDGLRVAPLPWPDGTSTVLPVGTALHLPQGRAPGAGLVARTAGGDVLYCPDVPDGLPTC